MKVYNMRDLNPLQFFRGPTSGAAELAGMPAEQGLAAQKPIPRNPSLLFDIELEEGQTRKDPREGVQDTQRRLQCLTEPWSLMEKQLMEQVEDILGAAGGGGEPMEADELAERLLSRGYAVTVRTALGGGGGGECLRNLRHVFLSVGAQGAAGVCLVDPKFREQFEIAHSTPRYDALLAAVGSCFVGTEERLVPLVELLCLEMSAAFRAAGATLPPWRQASSMLSKWRPRRSSDETRTAAPFGSFGPAPRQAPAAAGKPAGGVVGRTFTVTATAADGCGPPAAAPPVYPAQRRSLMSGCLGEKRAPAPAPAPAAAAARSACCRAQVSRTAASLLAAELGRPAKGVVGRRIGSPRALGGAGSKALSEDNDSPTSVLDDAEVAQQQQQQAGGRAGDALACYERPGPWAPAVRPLQDQRPLTPPLATQSCLPWGMAVEDCKLLAYV